MLGTLDPKGTRSNILKMEDNKNKPVEHFIFELLFGFD